MSLTIVDVNDPPVAKFDAKSITVTSTTTIPVTGNDVSGPVVGARHLRADRHGDRHRRRAAEPRASCRSPPAATASSTTRAAARPATTRSRTRSPTATARRAIASVFVTIDRPGTDGLSTKPITDTPALAFITGSTIGSTTPMKLVVVRRARQRQGQGYRVDQSTNGGSSYKTLLKATKATSSDPQPRHCPAATAGAPRRPTRGPARAPTARRSSRGSRGSRTPARRSCTPASWLTHSTSSASGGTEHTRPPPATRRR